MKIAFCFSGQLRTAEYAAEGILRFIGNLLPNIDFFVHTWDQNLYRTRYYGSKNVVSILEKLKLEDTPRLLDSKILMPFTAPSTYEVLEKITPIYKFQSIKIEKFSTCARDFHAIYKKLQPHMYGWYQVNELKRRHEEIYNFKYDYVVRTRPDYLFAPTDSLEVEIEKCNKSPNCFFGQPGSNNRLNDVFYIAKSDIMDIAASWMIKNPFINIADFMKENGIAVGPSLSRYSIYRPDSIPTSSLNYATCYNNDKDWYSTKNDTHRFKIEDPT